MDDPQVLLGRVDSLLQELDDARSVLQTLDVEDDLLERASGTFEKLFKEKREALDDLRRTLGNGAPSTGAWFDLDSLEQDTKPLFREYLAFVEGLLVRRGGVDNGLCTLADALLDDVSRRTGVRWGRFTILADGEAYADLAEIIRLRFPDLSIWSLPVAVHEFGHFAAERLEERSGGGPARRPFVELLERPTFEIRRPAEAAFESYAHELFADVFATYVVGPAYALCCLLLRFNPRRANADGRTHPAPARRAHVVLRTLARIDEVEGKRNRFNRPYRELVEELRGTWAESVRAAGQTAELGGDGEVELDEIADRFWRLVDRGVNPDAMYGWKAWLRAESVADGLSEGKPPAEIARDGELTMSDVVNGAWLARLGFDLRSRSAVAALSRDVFALGAATRRRA